MIFIICEVVRDFKTHHFGEHPLVSSTRSPATLVFFPFCFRSNYPER